MARSNSHFKRHSAVFSCRYCGRKTRDVNGDNGNVELCPDCEQGCMWENGYTNTDDPVEKVKCEEHMDAHFQAAVDKGGVIEGYVRNN